MAISVTCISALAGQAGQRATKKDDVLGWFKVNMGSGVSAGGVAVAASDFTDALNNAGYPGTVSTIDELKCLGVSDDLSIYMAHDVANDKIIAYGRADDAEDTGDLSDADKHCVFFAALTLS